MKNNNKPVIRNGHRINVHYDKTFSNNCPVLERTGDGTPVGTCCFYLKDGKTCPRHGLVKDVKGKDNV